MHKEFWHPPENGFEVSFGVSSITIKPEVVTELIGLEPTKFRHAKDEVRKYNIWQLDADSSLNSIQEQVDYVMSQIQPSANRFRNLKDCDCSLNVYIYPVQFKQSNPDTHASFNLDVKWIELLYSMRASFVLD